MIQVSSAGIYGWADAKLTGAVNPEGDRTRSGTDLPPAADEYRHGEKILTKTNKDPPDSKP